MKYEIKKKWFGFWQRYKLRTQLKITSKLFLVFIIVWLIGSALTILSQWAFTDHYDGTPFQCKYLKYFWPVIIELVSGFDIPHKELGLNTVSDILAVVMLITGIVILAIFTGQIVSMFIHVIQRLHHLPEKPVDFVFKRPVVICGINSKLHRIVEGLRKNPLAKKRELVIVDNQADQIIIKDKDLYKDVWYVKGNCADRSVIKKTKGEKETTAIILSSEQKIKDCGRHCDSRAIETAMAIEGHLGKTHSVLELIDERNIPHLKHTKINEWISVLEYANKLISQAAMQHGMGSVYHYLLGGGAAGREANHIYITRGELPGVFVNLTYQEVRDKILSESSADITLIGFARYLPAESSEELSTDIGHSQYVKQLNPVSMKCRCCGENIKKADELGRIQKICPQCVEKEKNKSHRRPNPWYFPVSTRLNRKDRLIYLAGRSVDLNEIFVFKKRKKIKNRLYRR